ncbi:hypothetical protein Bca52824_031702 [Brassica carinata]|uniref:Uncharacterized protein n=1 Tax=Brassica carinata TaxID=52824 RepID=A0A8X7V7Y9_BRACI|nr:hypothetical protein Bca52824_031702 [Brassica carinata]
MSRCYPFPPPGFVPNQIRDESLIEPIKKGTKEEVNREKKNKDKKRKERDSEAGRSRKHSHHKRQRKDENANASKKVDDDELECLEKSCLTMELDHQTSSQNSSDSTLHSNENEGPNYIQSQPLNGRHNDSESSIRVLLHGKRQKYPEVMMTNKDQKQSSYRDKLDASHAALFKCVGHPYSANQAPPDASRVCQEKTKESIRPSNLGSKCSPSMAMRFFNLIENWAPDRVESKLNDSEDQELWLLMKVGAKRQHQVSIQTTRNGSSSMVWPTAQFLPEAELYALPFTLPF